MNRINSRTVAWGVVASLLASLIAGGWQLWRAGFFDRGGWLWGVMAFMFAIGCARVLALMRVHRHCGITVLWLRRFGETGQPAGDRNRWIWATATEACRGLAILVSLQDKGIRGSQNVGRALQNPLSICALLIGIPLSLVVALWLFDRVDHAWLEGLVIVGFLMLYFGMFVFVGRLAIWTTTSFASIQAEPKEISRKLKTLKTRGHSHFEMLVMRCNSKDWKPCVLAALDAVDVVVIDVTEDSGNIDWEKCQARERLDTQRVLLLRTDTEVAEITDDSTLICDAKQAQIEIDQVKQDWGEDDFGERVKLGPYGKKIASQLRAWIEDRCS